MEVSVSERQIQGEREAALQEDGTLSKPGMMGVRMWGGERGWKLVCALLNSKNAKSRAHMHSHVTYAATQNTHTGRNRQNREEMENLESKPETI